MLKIADSALVCSAIIRGKGYTSINRAYLSIDTRGYAVFTGYNPVTWNLEYVLTDRGMLVGKRLRKWVQIKRASKLEAL